ncbi:AcrR family transcriptional regulator [Chitinivorax tropicus]|uniref:AcrR family transcriptional regulator n=1 Tax=Chitinivorax tropicus TaxID=714531 RepID=A0A840MLF0_9PROT|nr:TetR/AcrR family transcriptional regulator [Chitinivorax tropicus]MBB5017003.1 AcrR family transcriptional regulator [Chitinivorax tropicus]
MDPKPKRQTKARILDVSLTRFNAVGESNVTTTEIGELLNISPGNLYYHFKNKEAIVDALFEQFRQEFHQSLALDAHANASLEDLWLYLHLLFQLAWKYRFLYRDPVNVVSRYAGVASRLKQIIGLQARSVAGILTSLAASGELRASQHQLQTLTVNMLVIANQWLSFEYVRQPRQALDSEVMANGVYQTMSLVSPLLSEEAQLVFDHLAGQYLAQ